MQSVCRLCLAGSKLHVFQINHVDGDEYLHDTMHTYKGFETRARAPVLCVSVCVGVCVGVGVGVCTCGYYWTGFVTVTSRGSRGPDDVS